VPRHALPGRYAVLSNSRLLWPPLARRFFTLIERAQTILHACKLAGETLLKVFQNLAGVVVGAFARCLGIALGQLHQALVLGLNRGKQAILFHGLAHLVLGFADQAILLGDHAPGLLQLVGHSHAHAVNDIENTLFIDQQAAAEEDAATFGQRVFQFVN
jgi:hypothetical protein